MTMGRRKKDGIVELVQAFKDGDIKAFTRLVRLHQQSAYTSACMLLKDFDLAHDAVQESFLTVYYKIFKLKRPEAFQAWLMKIIRFTCYRYMRQNAFKGNPVTAAIENPNADDQPDRLLERKERQQLVLDTINDLPGHLKEVVLLYYLEEHSQIEVAGKLGISKSTVNNRLHQARHKLKTRMFDMVKDTLKTRRLPDDFADSIAEIVRVQGNIIEAKTAPDQRPMLFDQWILADNKKADGPCFTVIQRDINGRIKLISSETHQTIRAGSRIISTEGQPVTQKADNFLEEIISMTSKKGPQKPEIIETGIKIIDLLTPLPAHGTIGILGHQGVGKAVFIKELYNRLMGHTGKIHVFFFASQWEAINIRSLVDREPDFPPDFGDSFESMWFVSANATDPEYALSTKELDTAIYFSPLKACRGLYPAIDCLYSGSQMLSQETASEDHLNIVARIKDLLSKARQIDHDPLFYEYVANGAYARARERYKKTMDHQPASLSSDQKTILNRSRKIELFLTQPFYTAEPFSGIPGNSVPLRETIKGCSAILNGEVDDIPDAAFISKGSLEEVIRESNK